MEQGTHGGPHHLGAEGIHTALQQNKAQGSRRIRRTDDGSQVAGILDPVQNHHRRVIVKVFFRHDCLFALRFSVFIQNVAAAFALLFCDCLRFQLPQIIFRHGDHCQHPLGRFGIAKLRHHFIIHLVKPHALCFRRLYNFIQSAFFQSGKKQIRYIPIAHRFCHCTQPFRKKRAPLRAEFFLF